MSNKQFQMKLSCSYTAPDNSVEELKVHHLVEGHWVPLDLNVKSAGFDIFVYAIFTCQHMYFRVNAAEKGLKLVSSAGEISITTAEDWKLQSLDVHFAGKLEGDLPDQDTIDYIASRMGQCPVSKNLDAPADSITRVEFS